MELSFDTIYKVICLIAAMATIIRGFQESIQHGE